MGCAPPRILIPTPTSPSITVHRAAPGKHDSPGSHKAVSPAAICPRGVQNYNSKINSGHNLNEKVEEDRPAEDYNSLGNRNVDVNVNYNDADMTGDDNQNEDEQFNSGRVQTDNSEGDASGKLGKRAAPTGAWGSKFWKVCQPMSDSGDAEYDHNDLGEDAGDNYSEDSNGQKDRRQSQRGHVEVPAEEMLSDDYYEQDGEEQSDSLHGSGPSHLNVSGSRLLTKPVSVSKSIAKDDADFEPESSDPGKGRKSKVGLSYTVLYIIMRSIFGLWMFNWKKRLLYFSQNL
ncbi:hypothetical protein B296_00004941 [Ensete ventricosum]|uniref:Uncharacterized protein n=1 Tax=Ensete ventricosum TaxID=4639 RepID=A0A426ZAM4_ENSVE|nr:hypothetical protein B296_00004941 [Ensete ventricosum]